MKRCKRLKHSVHLKKIFVAKSRSCFSIENKSRKTKLTTDTIKTDEVSFNRDKDCGEKKKQTSQKKTRVETN